MIAHCHGTDCPQREECRRYVEVPAIPARWGSWDADSRAAHAANWWPACDGYWPIKRDD